MGPNNLRHVKRITLEIALGISVATAFAQSPSLENLLDEDFKIPLWYKAINVRGGMGYKDNVLLSRTGAKSSAYWKSGLDALVYRLPTHGWQFNCFATGDDLRYFDTTAVDNEQVAIAAAQLAKDWGRQWKTTLAVNYMFQNQVFDVSTTQTNQFNIGKVVGHGLTGRWSVRKDVGACWAEAEFSLLRQWLDAPLDDYWQGAPRLVAGRQYGTGSDVSVSYQWSHLAYDTREEVDATGRLRPGTALRFQLHAADLNWHHVWDRARRWHLMTGVGVDMNQDSRDGYFDYWNYRASGALKYRTENWEVRGQARIGYYDYPVQRISPSDSSSPKRHRTLISAGVHAERKLAKSLKVFADYAHDRSLSNLDFDQYRANVVSAGLDWEF